jgi:acyl-CoA reductase-like NAD-dependent aldehyde dehydrogenase
VDPDLNRFNGIPTTQDLPSVSAGMSDALSGVQTLSALFDALPIQDARILEEHMTSVTYAAGTAIFKVGDEGDACYLVDQGVVRIDLDRLGLTHSEIDSDSTLGYIEPGGILGELTLLDGLPRSASAYAQTEVSMRRIDQKGIEALLDSNPRVGAAVFAAMGRDAASKLRRTNERLAQAIFTDAPDPEVDVMVARAVAAQRAFVDWPEDKVDALLFDMAHAVADRAEELARANVAETQIGKIESKIIKNRVSSLGTFEFLAGKPGLGIIARNYATGVTEIADPIGVIFGLGPVTNPVSTFIFKALICVKTRNALILSPNRRSANVSARVDDLVHEALEKHGAPRDLIQSVRVRSSRKKTAQFMTHPDVGLILATGGSSMVKAAYSSGTPAIGVGPGNTPVLIASDADLPSTVGKILLSKPFDNGMPCGSEHNLVVVSTQREHFIQECERQGAAVLDNNEADRFTAHMVDDKARRFIPDFIGRPAAEIASHCTIHRPYPIDLIIVPADELDSDNPYAREKLMPVLSLFTAGDDDDGVEKCRALLMIDGCGHTAAIHSSNTELIQRYGKAMPASRILVNSPCVHGLIGLTTGLLLTATLGCGTFGGTSTTDNVTYTHLQNVKRLAEFDPVVASYWAQRIAEEPASAV